jgi:hypothetical protein
VSKLLRLSPSRPPPWPNSRCLPAATSIFHIEDLPTRSRLLFRRHKIKRELLQKGHIKSAMDRPCCSPVHQSILRANRERRKPFISCQMPAQRIAIEPDPENYDLLVRFYFSKLEASRLARFSGSDAGAAGHGDIVKPGGRQPPNNSCNASK